MSIFINVIPAYTLSSHIAQTPSSRTQHTQVLPQGVMVAEDVDCLGVKSEGGEEYKDNSK